MQNKASSMNIMDLPDEIMLYILQFMPDVDLQAFGKVTPKFRRLASDIILWKHFRMVRNSSIIKSRLFINSRPDRISLIRNNVLKGITQNQVESGEYVLGSSQRQMHEQQAKLSWLMKEHSINRRLNARPRSAELAERGVLPKDHSPTKSAVLAARAQELKRTLQQAVLYRKLQKRQSFEDLGPSVLKVKNANVARSLQAIKLGLEKQFAEHQLQKLIVNRPAIEEVESQLADVRGLALMVCPSVRPKIRLFEDVSRRFSSPK